MCTLLRICPRCGGSGAIPAHIHKSYESKGGGCPSCDGSGKVPCTAEMLADEYTAVCRDIVAFPDLLHEIDKMNEGVEDPNTDWANQHFDAAAAMRSALDNLGVDGTPCGQTIRRARQIVRDRGYAPQSTGGQYS